LVIPKPAAGERIVGIMPANNVLPEPVKVYGRQAPSLTVNIVVPGSRDAADGAAGFARLLFGLTALALERFGAVPENHSPDVLRELRPSGPTGVGVDPFDGQLLCVRKMDSGYQVQSLGIDPTEAPGGQDCLALHVEAPP
jgi:hypothetical protein